MLSGTAGAWNTTIVRGLAGQDMFYDAAGQRRAVARTNLSGGGWYSDWWGGYYVPGNYNETREIYNYDGAGRLSTIRQSEGAGVDEYSYSSGTPIPSAPSGPNDRVLRSHFTYDKMGRMDWQSDYNSANSRGPCLSPAISAMAEFQIRACG